MSDCDSPSSPGLKHSSEIEKVVMKGRRVRSRISGVHKKMVRSIENRASRNTSEEVDEEGRAPNYEMISRSPKPKVNRLERQKAVRISEPALKSEADNMQNVDEVVRQLLSVSGLDSSLLEDPRKKKEVYNFVKKNEVARAVTMRRRTINPKTAIAGNGTKLTDPSSSNNTPHTTSEEVTTTPPPPPPPPPPPTIETRDLGKFISDKQDVLYSKPGISLA